MGRRGLTLFAAMCVIWGIPYLLIRVAVRELEPETLAFSRTALAALILVPIAGLRGDLRGLGRRWAPILVFTVIEIVVPWYLLAHAETELTSSLTGLLIAAVPLVGAVVTTLTGERERHGARRWAGLLVGMVGVGLIVGLDVHGAGALPLAEIAVVAVCYAVGPIVLARWLSDAPALGVIATSIALAAVIYTPFEALSLPKDVPGWKVDVSVVLLAVVCTALAFVVFFQLIGEVGPVRATVITYVNPAVAAVLGVAILGEHLTAGMVAGFALVLAGSVLATRARLEPAGGADDAPQHEDAERRRAEEEDHRERVVDASHQRG